MGSNLFTTFLMLLLAISGAPAGGNGRANDLLDMIPSASYWRVKGVTVSRQQLEADIGPAKASVADIPKLVKNLESLRARDDAKKQLEIIGAPALDDLRNESTADDPEAAAMAKGLVASISSHAKVVEVRRLIAIRTLGERQEKESLPLLKTLLDSKELFVADYAGRAVAAIEGTPLKAENHKADLAGDLDLLPASTGMVAQTTGLGMPGFTLETLVAQAYGANHAGKVAAAGENDDTIDRLTRNVLDYAEAVGNVRVDGLTFAMSSGIGQPRGGNEWVLFSVHGLYDRDAVASFVQAQEHDRGTLEHDGDLMIYGADPEAKILFPSNHQLIFATADPEGTPLVTITAPLIETLTSGKPGTLTDNTDLAAAIKATDKSGPLWAAAIVTPTMRMLPAFAAFDTITLASKVEKGAVSLTVTGRGTGDATAAQNQIGVVQTDLIDAITPMAKSMKDFQPLLDAVQSVRVAVDEKGAILTATLPVEISRSLLAEMMQMMRGITLVDRPQPGPAGPAELP